MMKCLVTGRDKDDFLRLVGDYNLDIEFVSDGDFDIYVGYGPEKYDLSRCTWVHSLAAGVNQFMDSNIKLLTRTTNQFGEIIGGYCLNFILDHKYNIYKYNNNQKNRVWEKYSYSDADVLIYGTGNIGMKMAEIFKGLGIKVFGVNTSGVCGNFDQVFTNKYEGLNKVNFIINTMPLTDKTLNYFDYDFFDHCNGQTFINVGRGKSVDVNSLEDALDSGKIKKAILDVFDIEPLDKDSILWEKAIVTPHISGLTDINSAVKEFVLTYKQINEGNLLTNIVDINKQY